MSEPKRPEVGSIIWRDLTVRDAESTKDFYCQVVGWKATPHEMGQYVDYNIHAPESGDVVAGICHSRGANASLPAQWLVYVTVADVEASAKRCVELGGEVLDGPRMMGKSPFCVIRDPAGAVAALIEG